MRTFRRHTAAWVCCVSALLLAGCATPAVLNGGPRDTEPPRIVQSEPALEATGVSNPVVRIRFDEYVTLNAPTDSIRITPAQQKAPNYQLKGKSLMITLKDSLLPNTTYHIDIQSGVIKDLTENNPMPSCSFVFSTGQAVDSFYIEGTVSDAYTHLPVANACVMLFKSGADSCPLSEASDFFTLTDKKGRFRFDNIPDNPYRIYALSDKNFNRIYDRQDEGFAFLPQNPQIRPNVMDTADTTGKSLLLYLYQEQTDKVKFLKNSSIEKGIHTFAFNMATDTFLLKSLDGSTPEYKIERKPSGDTLTVYFYDSGHVANESFLLRYDGGSDTITLNPYGNPIGLKYTPDSTRKPLACKAPAKVEIGRRLELTFGFPLRSVDSSAFFLREINRKEKDTQTVDNFHLNMDPAQPCRLILDHTLKPSRDYILIIKDSACIACNGQYNDSLKMPFTIKGKKEYGNLQLTLRFPEKTDYVVQLADDKYSTRYELVVSADSISGDSAKVFFPNVTEGKYLLRVIKDLNGNRLWDSGKYRLHQHPEPLYYSERRFEVKKRWTIEETVEVKFK